MKNISKIDVILIILILDIVFFVNYYSLGQRLYELLVFIPIYTLLVMYFRSIWGYLHLDKNRTILRRSLLSVLYVYFTLILIVKIIAVISSELHSIIYTKRYINYAVALGFGFGLFIYPLWLKFKEWRIK